MGAKQTNPRILYRPNAWAGNQSLVQHRGQGINHWFKRLLHNRTADDLNLHVLEPFDTGMPLKCCRCHKSIALAHLSRFVQEKCVGALDANNLPEPRQAKQSVKLQNRVGIVEQHNLTAAQHAKHLVAIPQSLEDSLKCIRPGCTSESAHGWRRFHRFAQE